jgi:hypothetical protein
LEFLILSQYKKIMEWQSDLFESCYLLGFLGEEAKFKATQKQADFIQLVLFCKENFTFSELEKIKTQSKEIWIEVKENKIVEHTKYSIIMGIILHYNRGVEFKTKTKNNSPKKYAR